MKHTNKLTVPDLISTGVFTALYFVLVAVATFSSVVISFYCFVCSQYRHGNRCRFCGKSW